LIGIVSLKQFNEYYDFYRTIEIKYAFRNSVVELVINYSQRVLHAFVINVMCWSGKK